MVCPVVAVVAGPAGWDGGADGGAPTGLSHVGRRFASEANPLFLPATQDGRPDHRPEGRSTADESGRLSRGL
jgi:hypothetical protein